MELKLLVRVYGNSTCVLPDLLCPSIHLCLFFYLPLTFLLADQPDVFAVQTGRVDVPMAGTAQLSCTYDSVPAPSTVYWRHNNVIIDPQTNSNITVVYNDHMTTLTRTNMLVDEAAGACYCVAGNVLGESEGNIHVLVFVASKWRWHDNSI